MLQLHLISQLLFELGQGGQQGLCWLDRAGGVAAVREKLLDLVADIDHVEMQVALGAIVKRVGTAALEVDDGIAVQRWYENLTGVRGVADNTAVRHFNVMHHMMEKASTIWSKETGLDRNPADLVEVRGPDDSRERYLSEEELRRLMEALDERMYRKGTKDFNQTNLRMRLIVLLAVSTGMRSAEIHRLRWSDVRYSEGLLAVRAKLKKGKERFVPMTSDLAEKIRRFPTVIGQDRIFPPKGGLTSKRQRLEGSFEDLLERANIHDFWFHDVRHTFASWYMMNGSDLYELAKLLGYANIKMTERYANLGRAHITKTGLQPR